METIKLKGRLSSEERETVLVYDNVDKVWCMDTTIPKHFRKAVSQGWTPIRQYVDDDGGVCGMVLTAADRSITIRNVEKKQLSDKQMKNLTVDEYEEEK